MLSCGCPRASAKESAPDAIKARAANYANLKPTQWWGETNAPHAITKLPERAATDNAFALTFDACGGPTGNGYDADLIRFLIDNKVPATLFITGIWADAHPKEMRELADNSLFEIENHGYQHIAASVNGRATPYRVNGAPLRGAASVEDFMTELLGGAQALEAFNSNLRFYRPATTFHDDVALRIATDEGFTIVNYSVNGDSGATEGAASVTARLNKVNPRDILIMHMNHPGHGTAEGLKRAWPQLLQRGLHPVRLDQYY